MPGLSRAQRAFDMQRRVVSGYVWRFSFNYGLVILLRDVMGFSTNRNSDEAVHIEDLEKEEQKIAMIGYSGLENEEPTTKIKRWGIFRRSGYPSDVQSQPRGVDLTMHYNGKLNCKTVRPARIMFTAAVARPSFPSQLSSGSN